MASLQRARHSGRLFRRTSSRLVLAASVGIAVVLVVAVIRERRAELEDNEHAAELERFAEDQISRPEHVLREHCTRSAAVYIEARAPDLDLDLRDPLKMLLADECSAHTHLPVVEACLREPRAAYRNEPCIAVLPAEVVRPHEAAIVRAMQIADERPQACRDYIRVVHRLPICAVPHETYDRYRRQLELAIPSWPGQAEEALAESCRLDVERIKRDIGDNCRW